MSRILVSRIFVSPIFQPIAAAVGGLVARIWEDGTTRNQEDGTARNQES